MTALRRHAGWALLALVVAWATWVRLGVIAAGPDPDIDAYSHFQIAHKLVTRWRDLRVHWVWLPLWHAVDFAVYRLGGGITAVRYVSVACAALSSFVLTAALRSHLAARPSPTPWIARAEEVIPWAAGAAHALWPQNLSAGASAEPEALFQLLVLSAAAAWQWRRYALTGAALSLAAMLRYEAWPVLPVFLAMWWRGERTARAAVAWVAPGLAVAAWVALHRWSTGAWLWFLRENGAYVAGAWREFRYAERALPKTEHPWLWYPVIVPFLSVREWLWLALPGAPWLAWRGPRPLALTSAALLAVVTLVWVARSNLGLERHFTAVIPAYATMFAAGVALPVAALASRLWPARHDLARVAVAAALALVGARFAKARTLKRAGQLHEHAREAFVSERRVADTLRAQARPGAPVFADNARVEVMSGLDPRRFVRWKPAEVGDYNLLVEAARHGEVWVAGAPGDLARLHDGVVVVYRDEHMALLRRRAPAVINPRLRSAPCAD